MITVAVIEYHLAFAIEKHRFVVHCLLKFKVSAAPEDSRLHPGRTGATLSETFLTMPFLLASLPQ